MVGIACGEATPGYKDQKHWDYIPITYADLLLTPMQLGNTLEQLQSLDSKLSSQHNELSQLATAVDKLRKRVDWGSVWDASNKQCPWRLTYKKLIPGPPFVSSIQATFQVYYEDPAQAEPQPLNLQTENSQPLPVTLTPFFDQGSGGATDTSETRSGSFCLQDLFTKLESERGPYGTNSKRIRSYVQVKATLIPDFGSQHPSPDLPDNKPTIDLVIPDPLGKALPRK